MALPYEDRVEAGRVLGELVRREWRGQDPVVLALPRGGVPVAYEVARMLQAPLDVFLVRKLGVPGHPELAMGAIASGGTRVINEDVVSALGIPQWAIDEVAAREQRELERREEAYRDGRPPVDVAGRDVILVDDGLATGASMLAAVEAVKKLHPRSVTVAVPLAAAETCEALQQMVDQVICAATPEPFHAVGLWYRRFPPTTDEEVRNLLQLAEQERVAHAPGRSDS